MNYKSKIRPYIPDSILDIRRRIQSSYPYRPYMDKYKCIFIHIPKTAGTSILSLFMGNEIIRDHKTADCFKVVNPEKFEKYYKFAFVRNPWDRTVSSYEYLKSGKDGAGNEYFQELFKSKYNTFDKFVLEYLDKDSIHNHPLFKPQYRYVYNHKWECMVDYIGYFEHLDKDFKVIAEDLGINATLAETNKSKRKPYQHYFSNTEVKDKISFLYSKDIELFNYKFESKEAIS